MSAISQQTVAELKASIIPGIFADPMASAVTMFARVLNRRVTRIATMGVSA